MEPRRKRSGGPWAHADTRPGRSGCGVARKEFAGALRIARCGAGFARPFGAAGSLGLLQAPRGRDSVSRQSLAVPPHVARLQPMAGRAATVAERAASAAVGVMMANRICSGAL